MSSSENVLKEYWKGFGYSLYGINFKKYGKYIENVRKAFVMFFVHSECSENIRNILCILEVYEQLGKFSEIILKAFGKGSSGSMSIRVLGKHLESIRKAFGKITFRSQHVGNIRSILKAF